MEDGRIKYHLDSKSLGAPPINCDILLDLSLMNKVLHVDQASKQATVESGITITSLS
jgi:FAD/FMN-containing dehydrogenase